MLAQIRGDRQTFQANSDRELVALMHQNSWDTDLGLQEYMDQYAFRLKQWDNTTINTNSPTEFILDLKRCGELRTWDV